jgi:protein-L-isoaspartate O-methyltransferase
LTIEQDGVFHQWLTALEARHLADLRVPEVTRALRALSSAYVQRRHKVAAGATLDSAGKRAAFALFYGPLHFITVARVLHELAAGAPPPASILDLGCGTGVAGAAWARHAGGSPFVSGLDRHPWAVEEARWTYRQMALHGQARAGDLTRIPAVAPRGAIVAAYALNEVPEAARAAVEDRLLHAAAGGAAWLVVEPIARGITPWWDSLAARVAAIGGRADEWRFDVDLPPLLRLFDKAAGLDHRELTARTLYVGPPAERGRPRDEQPAS